MSRFTFDENPHSVSTPVICLRSISSLAIFGKLLMTLKLIMNFGSRLINFLREAFTAPIFLHHERRCFSLWSSYAENSILT